jgi:hypothetical protein
MESVAQNWFCTVALVSWALFAIWLYQVRPIGKATLWTILGAQLLLPVGASIKIEGVPQFDKISIPNLAALIGCILVVRRPLRIWTKFGFAGILILIYLIGPVITAELNRDPIFLANKVLPAEGHYDAFSAVVGQFLTLIPFFLGRHLLRSSADNEEILRVLVIAGLLYSLPILFEVRMSPQLHTWIYGYFPHSFAQQMRDAGFRPVVFMGHGLLVAFFMMTTAVAAAALWRMQYRIRRLPPAGITAYLSTIVILCKGGGSIVYGATLVPLVRFGQPRLQLRLALVLVIIALLYPMLRTTDLFPTNSLVEAAGLISVDRAGSLKYRFDHDQELLERASQRFLFGWGRWGRSRIYNEYGTDISVSDGRWIIILGQFGLCGFLAEFGLLAFSVFRAASAFKLTKSKTDQIALAALALIVAVNVIDLLPNAWLAPWTWLLAGALLGRAESLLADAR